MLKVSVGVPVYNEEANIGQFLKSLLRQELEQVQVTEIVVVASGCTDQTVPIVREYQKKDKRIKILEQPKRAGKTAADNLFFREAKEKILVLCCGDTILEKDCLEMLVEPFSDSKVGMTGAQIIPLNDKKSLAGFYSCFWWGLLHRVNFEFLKTGEVLAFRALVSKIPEEIGADEVYLTDRIFSAGYQGKYVPEARVYNMGPGTIGDIIKTRRRQACHHLEFRRFGPQTYYPKTMDNFYVLKVFLRAVKWSSPKEVLFSFTCAVLETVSRFLAYFDFYLGKNYRVWSRSLTTKRLRGLKI
ncbi:MAG: glycosyltransferase [bacterium]|nr:glycosyltransferase [bacterium]